MEPRRAASQDLAQVRSLLAAEGLAPLPSSLPLSNILVALERGVVHGAVAVEVVARYGVLRTVIVVPDRRRQGIGASLVRSLLSRCHELGLRDLFSVSEKQAASEFLVAQGFGPCDRSQLPAEVRSWLRSNACPDAAAVLQLPLEARW